MVITGAVTVGAGVVGFGAVGAGVVGAVVEGAGVVGTVVEGAGVVGTVVEGAGVVGAVVVGAGAAVPTGTVVAGKVGAWVVVAGAVASGAVAAVVPWVSFWVVFCTVVVVEGCDAGRDAVVGVACALLQPQMQVAKIRQAMPISHFCVLFIFFPFSYLFLQKANAVRQKDLLPYCGFCLFTRSGASRIHRGGGPAGCR